jgi:polysaccharide export outer membrane protein
MARILIHSLTILAAAALGAMPAWAASAKTKPEAESGKTPDAGDYVLQSGDVLRFVVFQEPDLEREIRISQEGTVALPLIETITLKDKTVRQAEEIIRQAYDKDFLVNPQVTITVKEYSKRTVSISGSVAKQGSISFPPEKKMTLIEAISDAGPNRLAYLKEVKLTRTLPDGTKKTYTINVDDLIKGNVKDDWPLQKDDVIFVPERLL